MEKENKKDMNCADCITAEILTDEIRRLQKDNERLQNGLIQTNEDLNNSISNKANTVFNQFGKEEVTKDKVMALLAALGNTYA